MRRTLEQPGCFRISANARACKSCIESKVFAMPNSYSATIKSRALTSKLYRSCAPGDRSHDRDAADLAMSHGAEVAPHSTSRFLDTLLEILARRFYEACGRGCCRV